MFRVYKQVNETTWQETTSLESLWAKWQLEALWAGKQVEYTNVPWTMSVPDGHTIVRDSAVVAAQKAPRKRKPYDIYWPYADNG
jgi:hypothetical protein